MGKKIRKAGALDGEVLMHVDRLAMRNKNLMS